MAEGGYVPDSLTNAIVAHRIGEPDAADGWLLDGYPRTAGQVIDAVISLTAETDVLVDRLLKRAALEGRVDDNAETIRHRMDIYAQSTDPLLATYRERGQLLEVDGIGTVDEVADRITSALDAKLA